MTTTTAIAELARGYAETKQAADNLYRAAREIEFELITALREEYPDEFDRWQRGIQSFKAEGVQIPLKREYDADKVLAEFGEEFPGLVVTETKTVTRVDGKAAMKLWADAALARRLAQCLVPAIPRVTVALAPASREAE